MRIRRVRSKWRKTVVINKHLELKRFQPETSRFSMDSLQKLLNKYGMVYIKPEGGTAGIGVIRVEQANRATSHFALRINTAVEQYNQFDTLYSQLTRYIGQQKYLVQQGIHLLTYNKRPFDLRVMVQRNKSNRWEMTGILARVAAPRKVVTNYHRGGTLHTIDSVLQAHTSNARIFQLKKQLQHLVLLTASHLNKHLPTLIELGIDIGLDKQLKPWIIEVNTQPDKEIFRFHPNKSIYPKMIRYVRYQYAVRTGTKPRPKVKPKPKTVFRPEPSMNVFVAPQPPLMPTTPQPFPNIVQTI